MTETLESLAKKYYNLINEIAGTIVDLESSIGPEHFDTKQEETLVALYSLLDGIEDQNFVDWVKRDAEELKEAVKKAYPNGDYYSVTGIQMRQEIDRTIISDILIEALKDKKKN